MKGDIDSYLRPVTTHLARPLAVLMFCYHILDLGKSCVDSDREGFASDHHFDVLVRAGHRGGLVATVCCVLPVIMTW